jgi:hypothetical protein
MFLSYYPGAKLKINSPSSAHIPEGLEQSLFLLPSARFAPFVLLTATPSPSCHILATSGQSSPANPCTRMGS